MSEKYVTIILDERDKELDELVQLVKERYNLSDEETDIVFEGFNKKQLKALCEIDKESGEIFLRLKIDAVKKLKQKGGVNRMTEKLTMEEFGNLVRFCEQKYRLSDEEVKIVEKFSEKQLKDLSNVSEKARMLLKEKFETTPFDYIRANGDDADIEGLNKFCEKL